MFSKRSMATSLRYMVAETIRVVEDYKSLDIEAASMGMTLCRSIRQRYPDWRYLIDGDGGTRTSKIVQSRKILNSHSQRRPQSNALPGRLGRGSNQTFADLQRRLERSYSRPMRLRGTSA